MGQTKLPDRLQPFVFKKGEAPNGHNTHPNGRQLKTLLKEVLQKKITLEDALSGEQRKMTVNEGIVLKLLSRALSGNLKAIEMVFDRIEGRPLQKVEQEVVAQTINHDLSRLAPEELLRLRETVQKIEVESANYDESQEVLELEYTEEIN